MALTPGTIVHDRYTVISLLGQGGMGAVYRAFDQRLSRQVAIKENSQGTAQFTAQFVREATLLGSLRHPNLPVVFDHFVLEGHGQYLVMEYIEGDDLQRMIEQRGALPEADALRWIDQVAAALGYLHRQNPPIIHRDVKPGNIKITPAGEAILVDFGIAKQFSDVQRTQTGAQAVTPGYSPPEQYGGASTDARSDVYALAATLNALVTGQPPVNSLDRLIGKQALIPPVSYQPHLSRHVSAAIVKALELNPQDRYASMADFRQALQRQAAPATEILAPATAARGAARPTVPEGMAPPAELPVPTGPARRRRGWLLAGAVGLPVILLLAAGAVLAVMSGNIDLAAFFPAPTATTGATPLPTLPPPTLTRPPDAPTDAPPPPEATDVPTALVLPTESPPPAAPSSTPAPEVTAGPTAFGGGAGRITFWSHESGVNRIFTVNPDGSDLGEIGRGVWPDWAPDGRTLAYVVNQLDPPDESLYVRDPRKPEPDYIVRVPVEDNHLDWSPDGQFILYSDVGASGFESRALVAIDPLTKEKTVILDDGFTNLDGVFSPDGSQVAFASNKSGDYEIYVMPTDGSAAPMQIVFEAGINDRYPAWSPDGTQIAFSSNRTGIDQIYVTRADGNDLARLTDTTSADRQPSYSLDGLYIVFASFRDGNLQIYIMDADGQNQTRLTTRYSFPNQNPIWQPEPK